MTLVELITSTSTHQFQLLEKGRGRVLSLNQRLSIVEYRTDHHAEREHVAEDATVGVDLNLGSCKQRHLRNYLRIINLRSSVAVGCLNRLE